MARYYVWIDKRVPAGEVIGAGIELPDGLDNAERDKLCFALINEILIKNKELIAHEKDVIFFQKMLHHK